MGLGTRPQSIAMLPFFLLLTALQHTFLHQPVPYVVAGHSCRHAVLVISHLGGNI